MNRRGWLASAATAVMSCGLFKWKDWPREEKPETTVHFFDMPLPSAPKVTHYVGYQVPDPKHIKKWVYYRCYEDWTYEEITGDEFYGFDGNFVEREITTQYAFLKNYVLYMSGRANK